MREAIQSGFGPDMRPMREDELDAVSGGLLPVIVFAATFAAMTVGDNLAVAANAPGYFRHFWYVA
jgi:hypothetical protein